MVHLLRRQTFRRQTLGWDIRSLFFVLLRIGALKILLYRVAQCVIWQQCLVLESGSSGRVCGVLDEPGFDSFALVRMSIGTNHRVVHNLVADHADEGRGQVGCSWAGPGHVGGPFRCRDKAVAAEFVVQVLL